MIAPVLRVKKIVGPDISKGCKNMFARPGQTLFHVADYLMDTAPGGFLRQRTIAADRLQEQCVPDLPHLLFT